MPTGPKHQRFVIEDYSNGAPSGYLEDCRCMIGEDHDSDGVADSALDVDDAADIWMSSGMDEDYTVGYSESDLKRAADRG